MRDGNVEQLKGTVDWTKEGDFLARGAYTLMLRKLVLEKFYGCIQSYCCDFDGEFALSQHIFHKPEQSLIFEKSLKIQRVDQLLIFDCGKISKISCFFSCTTGHLLKQMWNNNSYQIHINPISDLPPNNFPKNLHEHWQEDLEMMSKYLEFKAKKKEELKQKFESPCLKLALRDYINCLVKCKPKSVMNFTMEFMRKLEKSSNFEVLKTFDRRRIQNN